jgi:beta-mannanase
MKTIIRCLAASIWLVLIGMAYAGNWTGAGFTLSLATPSPAAAPTPPPAGGITTADPNANAAAKAELAWLQSQETAAGGQHIVQSNQDVVRQCPAAGAAGCAAEDAANYAADGNQYTGAIAVDYCNGYWGDTTTPMCVFGTGSDTNNQAKAWWAAGSLIQMSMHFPNPYNNYNVTAPGSATGVTCPGQSGISTQLQGLSDDCSGITASFITAMLTPGTAQNANWNHELSLFANGLLDLQNSGVVVILRLFHELDAGWFWWGASYLSSAQQAQLWQYTENYFESQGIHNVLYEYCIIGGVSGYPGNQYIDVVSWDQYGELPGSGYVAPQYSALAGYGKPIAIAENNCSSSGGACDTASSPYGYDAQDSDAEGVMPNLVWISLWWGPNPGTSGDPYWLGYMQDPYNVMRQNVPSLGR